MCLVSEGRDGGHYGFFVHPGEAVSLPFKYQCFSTASGSHGDVIAKEEDRKGDTENEVIKVSAGLLFFHPHLFWICPCELVVCMKTLKC